MDEIRSVLTSFWSWGALATGAIIGVWWSRMTPTTANLTLTIGIVAAAIAVFFFSLNSNQPLIVRLLWSIAISAVLSLVVYHTLWNRPPSQQVTDKDDARAIAELSRLGWTVKPGSDDIEFEIWTKPLPPMKESAAYFAQLQKPWRLHFQQVNSIAGLHELATIKGCTKIEINAGEFSDISDLRGFSELVTLSISQTPLNGLSVVDASPLASLTGLRKLNLHSTKIRSIDSLKGLTNLEDVNLGSTLIRDLTPLSKHDALKSLEIRDTEVSDLAAISELQNLRELVISGKQVPGLVRLASLTNLKRLTIIEQAPFDLSPVGRLTHLDYLWLWISSFDLASLRGLSNLHELMLTGTGFNSLSPVTDVDALGELRELQKLTIGLLDIRSLSFAAKLNNLEELNINQLPISSVEPLRSLKALKSVSLNMTNVSDISPLLDLPMLTSLSVLRTPARADVLTKLERRGVSIQR